MENSERIETQLQFINDCVEGTELLELLKSKALEILKKEKYRSIIHDLKENRNNEKELFEKEVKNILEQKDFKDKSFCKEVNTFCDLMISYNVYLNVQK